ncbi:MAG: flagellar basal body rod protein FlgF, partial [Alloalcanivorax venustensis]
MDRILYTAMSGARQSMDQQSVVSNNLANASTTGFRGQMQALRAVPVQGDGALATRTSVMASTPGADFSAGPMNATGRDLDVAMQGDAWLAVQATNGDEAYTRRGDLQVDGDGVLNSAGRPVIGEGGPIIVPLGAKLSMGADGTLSAIGAGEDPDALVQIGRVKLVNGGEGELQRG